LGTIPEMGAIRKAKKAINLLEVLILSEAINSLTLSSAPLLNKAAETANKPIKVIKDGLPKPDNAFWGVSTPVEIKIATHNKPVSSGAIVFLINNIIEISKTNTVINASELLLKKKTKFILNVIYLNITIKYYSKNFILSISIFVYYFWKIDFLSISHDAADLNVFSIIGIFEA